MGHYNGITKLLSLSSFLLASALLVSPSFSETATTEPVRGVWIANVASSSLSSPEKIRAFVDLAERCGMNTLYVVVWNRGMTTYPSKIMQQQFGVTCDPRYAKFDMLAEVTHAAHEKNMRVIAWFEFGFACSYRQPDGGPIIRKNPHWAARDSKGNLATKNGFQWMNAFHPEVQDFILSLLKEILVSYEVDGIQGDDRLPACPSLAGYDPWTIKLYQEQHGGESPPEDYFDKAWVNWRADLLNEFMRRMHRELKQEWPQKTISAAPSIYPWSKREYLQDWPTWLENGWVDEVCPQVYREDVTRYKVELAKIVSEQVAPSNLKKVFPGILVQTAERIHNDAKNVRGMIEANRTAGFPGEVIFYDAALVKHEKVFAELYQKN